MADGDEKEALKQKRTDATTARDNFNTGLADKKTAYEGAKTTFDDAEKTAQADRRAAEK